MWGKLASFASAVTGQDEEEEENQQTPQDGSVPMETAGADDQEMRLVEQQKLIIQLKEMIRDREKSLSERDGELKKISADFSKFKLQSKSKIANLSKQVQDKQKVTSEAMEKASVGSDESVSTIASEASGTPTATEQRMRAKMAVLKKQLQVKDRQVKEINEELEKKRQEVAAKERVIGEKDEELKRMSTKLEAASSQPKESQDSSSSADYDEMTRKQLQIRLEEMVAQMAYKDNKLIELMNQVTEREGGAMDLRETVAEKDEVIRGKDQAIALLKSSFRESEKREEGLQATMDRLKWTKDDLEEQVQRLKSDLERSRIGQQVSLPASLTASMPPTFKQDNEKELEEVTEMRERFSALLIEEKANSSATIEKLRTAYETHCRELETRLTDLQMENQAARDALSSRVEELEGLLDAVVQEKDEANRKLKVIEEEMESKESSVENMFAKFKVLAGSKIKALEKEVEQLKEATGELASLRNLVAELEEEKGNFQLQLLENEEKLSKKEMVSSQLDEMRQQCEDLMFEINTLKDKNASFEEGTSQWDATLGQASGLKKPEPERELDLVKIDEQDATIRCLEARLDALKKQTDERAETISLLQIENSDMKQLTIKLEEKFRNSEEQVLRLEQLNNQLTGNMQLTDGERFALQKASDDLRVENSALRSELDLLKERALPLQEDLKKMLDDMKYKEEEMMKLQNVLDEKNKILEDASIRLIDAVESSSELSQRLSDRDSELLVLHHKLATVTSENNEYIETIEALSTANKHLESKFSGASTDVQVQPAGLETSAEESFHIGHLLPVSENFQWEAPPKKIIFLTHSTDDLEAARLELERLNSLLEMKEMLLEQMRTENEKLGRENKSGIENLESLLTEKDEIIEKMKVINEDLISRESELTASVVEKNEFIDRMSIEKENLVQRLSVLDEENCNHQVEMKKKLETLDNLSQSYSSCQTELLLLQQEFERSTAEIEKLKTSIKYFEEEIAKKDQILAEKEKDFLGFSEDFDATVRKLTEIQEKLEDRQVGELTEEYKFLNVQKGKLEDEVALLTQKLLAVNGNLDLINQELTDLKATNSDLMNSNDCLKQDKDEAVSRLKAELDELRLNRDEVNKELLKISLEAEGQRTVINAEFQQSLAGSYEELKESKLETERLRQALTQYEREVHERDDRLSLLLQEVEKLRSESIEKEVIVKEKAEKLQASSFEMSASENRIVEMQGLLQQLSEELNKSKMESAELRESVKKLEKKLSDKEKKIESLSDILKDEEVQLIAAREELETLKKFQKDSNTEIGVQLRVKDDEIVKLNETVSEKDVTIKKYLVVMKKQKESLKQTKEELNQSLNSSNIIKDEELERSRQRSVDLEREVVSIKTSLEEQVAALKNESECLRCELSQNLPVVQTFENIKVLLSVEGVEVVENEVKNILKEKLELLDKIGQINKEVLHGQEADLALLKEKLETISKEKEDLTAHLQSQTIALEAYMKTEESLNADKINLESAISNLREALSRNEELLDILNGEKRFLKDENLELNRQLEACAQDLEEKLSKVDQERKKEKIEHEQDVESLNSELELSQKKLEECRKEIEMMTERLNDLKKINEADAEHFMQFKQENEVENLKLHSVISDFNLSKAAFEKLLAESEAELKAFASDSETLRSENSMLEKERESLELKLKNLSGEKSREDVEIAEYKSQLELLQFDMLRLREENEKFKSEALVASDVLAEFQKERFEMTRQLEELSSRSEVVVREKQSFESSVKEMEMEKLQRSSEQEDLRSKLSDLENRSQNFEKEFELLKGKLSEKTKFVEDLTKRLQAEAKRYEILESEFEELRLEKQQEDETVEQLKKKVHDLKVINHDFVKREESLKQSVDKFAKEISTKDKKLKSNEESKKKMVDDYESKVHELSERVELLEKERDSAVQQVGESSRQTEERHVWEVSKLKEDYDRTVAGLEEELKKLKDESELRLKTLQDQFDLLSNDVTSYQHLIAKLESNKKHLEGQMGEVKPMITKLREELANQEKDRMNLRRTISNLEAEKAGLESDIRTLGERVKIAEDLEDNLELDYAKEVMTYKDKLREMEEMLEKSKKAEEDQSQVNDKLLQNNNALIRNTEEVVKLKELELLTLTEERAHMKRELETVRTDLELLKKKQSESMVRVNEGSRVETAITHERLRSSAPKDVDDSVDDGLIRVHSTMKPTHLSQLMTTDAGVNKYQQVDMLAKENIELMDRWKESERKFSEKERELSEFYQQYQLLYQQYIALQHHLTSMQDEKKMTATTATSSTVPYETYKDLENLCRKLKEQQRELERQLTLEQERRSEVEEGLKIVRDQYEEHRMQQASESHSISLFEEDDSEERRILPQDANFYLQMRHKCLQLRRFLMRMDQTRLSFGAIYRYRTYLLRFLVFYFIFVHFLLLFRCS